MSLVLLFFWSRWSGRLPLARSLFGLRVTPIAPTFVPCDDLRKKVWVTFNLIFQILAQSQTSVFWSCVSRRGTNFAATCVMFKSTVKIRWQELQLTPIPSEILSIVYRRSSLIFCQIFSTFSSVQFVEGRPQWGWSSTLISPHLNHANYLKTCVWLSASSIKAFWGISCASVAVFQSWKQNLKQIRCLVQSHITILREELDNTWENWQHKPVQSSTATSAWLLTREGCNYTHLAGEHSTTIRKSSPKPVRFFLGPPLVHTYVHVYFSVMFHIQTSVLKAVCIPFHNVLILGK